MAGTTSFFALASGRLTPLSQVALTVGLSLFAAVIFLIQPVHCPAPRLVTTQPSARLLDRSSAWFERAALQEQAVLFMPSSQEDMRLADASQPDASPFPAFGAELRHDPAKPLALGSSVPKITWKAVDSAFQLSEDTPYLTLGQKPQKLSLTPRILQLQVYSDKNELLIKRDFRIGDAELKKFKALPESNLDSITPAEFRLGIDAMGVQSRPYLVRSSGVSDWDRTLGEWTRGLPWDRWLRQGSYRIVIVP